jgi:hypothetical protein
MPMPQRSPRRKRDRGLLREMPWNYVGVPHDAARSRVAVDCTTCSAVSSALAPGCTARKLAPRRRAWFSARSRPLVPAHARDGAIRRRGAATELTPGNSTGMVLVSQKCACGSFGRSLHHLSNRVSITEQQLNADGGSSLPSGRAAGLAGRCALSQSRGSMS